MELTGPILVTILFSAFFSGMEIAFVTANKLLFEVEKSKNKFSTSILSIFFENPKQFIATMLVGNNIALVIYGIMMAQLIEPFISAYSNNDALIVFTQTILSTVIILITAEFLPKTLFRINPNMFLSMFALPLLLCYIVFYPLASISAWLSFKLLRLLGIKIGINSDEYVFGKVDLHHILQENIVQNKEEIETDVKLFQNALDFSKIKLRECIVPRTEIVAVDIDESLEILKQKFIETGFSKILIYKETIDNIVGYFHLSDLFKNPKSLRSRIRKIPFVPETMVANKLMSVFIQEKKSIAIVVDEFGGTAGVVTLEDIMEEIFGEIEDEHDNTAYQMQQVDETHFILSARLEIDFINEKLALDLPVSEDYETIAGLILYHNEHLPKANDEILVKKLKFKILKASTTRIELVNMEIIE